MVEYGTFAFAASLFMEISLARNTSDGTPPKSAIVCCAALSTACSRIILRLVRPRQLPSPYGFSTSPRSSNVGSEHWSSSLTKSWAQAPPTKKTPFLLSDQSRSCSARVNETKATPAGGFEAESEKSPTLPVGKTEVRVTRRLRLEP